MKNSLVFSKSRLMRLSWHIWLFVVGFANKPIESPSIDNTPPASSLQFEKLSYDRGNSRLVIIIKNTGKDTAKDLSLRCTNINQDEVSRAKVLLNNTPTTTTISIPDLAAGSSTQEIYVAVDFQTAKEALV
jgi:hypothetical protein